MHIINVEALLLHTVPITHSTDVVIKENCAGIHETLVIGN